MEIRSMNTHFSLKRVILLCVLLNCGIIGFTLGFVFLVNTLTNSGALGFFDLGIIGFLLPILGMIAGFKIGNIYIYVYNIIAGILNRDKIELNSTI